MSRYHAYLNTASSFLGQYRATEPFASFLKKRWAEHKKAGSRDRKQIAGLCYAAFRLGGAGALLPVEERICRGVFLCTSHPDPFLEALRPAWHPYSTATLEQKLVICEASLSPADIFPWTHLLSDHIGAASFAYSHLQQPALFIRSRPGQAGAVQDRLEQAGIPYQQQGPGTFSLPSGTQLENILELNRQAVVQDASSQALGELMERMRQESASWPANAHVWDCCAASGGKSILAYDCLPGVVLTVSDVRSSILHNLRQRFREAGKQAGAVLETDLSRPVTPPQLQGRLFDAILADVPCTGSGTWGRTPEQLCFFEETAIPRYVHLQRQILTHVLPFLRPGGFLLYSTCSVFRNENEAQVAWLQEACRLRVVQQGVIEGYRSGSDTMYGALLQREG